jgi:hypothetical protein
MGIEVKDVPRWCTVHGISHAVANADGNWVSMACNTLIIGNDPERWEAIREEWEEVEQEVQP